MANIISKFIGGASAKVEAKATTPYTGNPIVDSCTPDEAYDRLVELRSQYRAGMTLSSKDLTLISQLKIRAGVTK